MVAIIPARGGSKGLPGKNIMLLSGKPLIAYTIEAARRSRHITRIIVSTDDGDIARTAVEYGAEVPFMRPPSLATDTALAIDTYRYTIDRLEAEGQPVTSFVVLLPTCPLRTADDIDSACELFAAKQADSVISYTPEAHPVSWHRYLDEEGHFENIFPAETLKNRQDSRVSYYPNGAIYVFSAALIRSGQYYSPRSFAYVMPRERSVDIDTLHDFRLAEFYLNHSSDEKTRV